MRWLKNLSQKMKESAEDRRETEEEKKQERIKVKCPLCKEKIPSNALRCSHCAGDLSGKEARENIKKQVKRRRRSIIIGIVVFVFIFLWIVILFSIGGQQQEQSTSIRIGDEGFLRSSDNPNQIVFLAVTPDAFDKLIKTILAKDSVGLLELAAEGNAFGVTNGAKVKVIDTAIGRREVRILEGVKPVDQDKIGLSGWVPYEWVKSR